MNITIIGGGNIGTQFAVHCAAKGHQTTLYVSKPHLFSKELSIVDDTLKTKLSGPVNATNDIVHACTHADLIFITYPAFMLDQFSHECIPHIKPGTYIGLIPGTGGGECIFKSCVDKGCVVFGLQRVPSVARLVTYGKSVKATGYRACLHLGAIPKQYTAACCDIISSIFDMPCLPLPNYLNVTLTPSNPILHTTRLCTLFKDYSRGVTYERIPLFYKEWSDESSRLLIACDEEVQNICRAVKDMDLSHVRSLKEHYESSTPEQLTRKMSSIQSLQGIATPSVLLENGRMIPDLSSRYFTADFPFGLCILIQIADLVGVNMPNCKEVYRWYQEVSDDTSEFSFRKYGITDSLSFYSFYNQ